MPSPRLSLRAGLLGASTCIAVLAPLAPAQIALAPDPAKVQQDFEGWGVSLCWWGHQVGRWNEANLIRLIDKVVNVDTGLGYNLFRYNIGGGDHPSHTHLAEFKAIPGYKPTQNGAYDWKADPYQRKVAALLQARGKNVVFEAFANSPPWWMTKNQCSGGNAGGSDNLLPEHFETFAEYLAEVSRFLQDSSGLRIRTLTPFNEPSSTWWTGTDKTQEGCGFANNQARMVKLLAQKIKAKNLPIGLSAADENSIAQALSGLQKYDDSALAVLTQLNTHSYAGVDKRKDLAIKAAALKKPLWVSESGPLNLPTGSTAYDATLFMADKILNDLKDMKVNAWLDWQLIDAGANWRSLDFNQSQQTFTPNKNFYMHAHFSRFIRPGSKILEGAAEGTLLVHVPETGNLVIVLLNTSTAEKNYSIDISKFPQAAATATLLATNATDNMKKLADLAVQGGKIAATVSAKSLVTVVLKAGPPTALRARLSRGQGLPWGHGGRQKAFSRAGLRVYSMSSPIYEIGPQRNATGRALRLAP